MRIAAGSWISGLPFTRFWTRSLETHDDDTPVPGEDPRGFQQPRIWLRLQLPTLQQQYPALLFLVWACLPTFCESRVNQIPKSNTSMHALADSGRALAISWRSRCIAPTPTPWDRQLTHGGLTLLSRSPSLRPSECPGVVPGSPITRPKEQRLDGCARHHAAFLKRPSAIAASADATSIPIGSSRSGCPRKASLGLTTAIGPLILLA